MATADVSTHPELKIARSALAYSTQQTCGPFLRTSRDACNGEFFRIVTSVTQQRTYSKSSTCTARSDVGNRLSINVGPAFHPPPATAPATAMIEELPTPPCRIRPAACMSRRSSGNPGLDWDDECRKRRVKPQRKRCNRVAWHKWLPSAPPSGQAKLRDNFPSLFPTSHLKSQPSRSNRVASSHVMR
ncbi:hypothetical protein BKA81DRAFT_376256 [Phyllosticta paracitricarpa]